jgi:rubrerythrin
MKQKITKKSCSMIAEAIADEKKGKQFYSRLSKELPAKSGKHMVSGIGKQEGHHKKKLKRLQKKLKC